ncbi:MAG: tetratricopeptide repeat protein, partial [Endomicrobia bacterium]|nr:tetratricopeptide repeat protein [Endomicrobiia bacterium]
QGRYEEAEKTILAATKYSNDPLIYEHLGDALVENNKINDAWVAYALSFDIGGGTNKNVGKKLLMVQEKLDKKVLFLKMLQRSENNYRRLPSFRAGYTAALGSAIYKVKTYVPFTYTRGSGVKIEIPGRFAMGGAAIYIKDGNIEFSPKALKDEIPAELSNILDFTSEIFSGHFYERFASAKITQKSGKIIYSLPDEELVLDDATALILKITKGGSTAEPVKYDGFFTSKLPSKIKAASKEPKFKCVFESKSFSLLPSDYKQQTGEPRLDEPDNSGIKNENNTESSGKN